MKRKYNNLLSKYSVLQNMLSLELLFDYGKYNLTNEAFYQKLYEDLKNENSNILSVDFKLTALENAKELSGMETRDLCQFIHDFNLMLNRKERER